MRKADTYADRMEAAGKTQCDACGAAGKCGNRYCSAHPDYRKPKSKRRYRSQFRGGRL